MMRRDTVSSFMRSHAAISASVQISADRSTSDIVPPALRDGFVYGRVDPFRRVIEDHLREM